MDTLGLVWHYFWQMLCGTVFFIMVALLAVGLHFFVTVLEGWELPWDIVIPVRTVEITLFFADLVVFLFFILIEAAKMIQEIRESHKC
jgi:hypothetical protein